MSSPWNDSRPMSPHLQIWKWHGAMMSSIAHRASAIASYVALIIVAIGVFIMSLTGQLPLAGLIFSPLGALGLFVFSFAFIFMALAQLRHAIWDKGAMMKPELNNTLSYVMLIGALVLAALVTFIAVGVAQ